MISFKIKNRYTHVAKRAAEIFYLLLQIAFRVIFGHDAFNWFYNGIFEQILDVYDS